MIVWEVCIILLVALLKNADGGFKLVVSWLFTAIFCLIGAILLFFCGIVKTCP